jgi:hypothetical protein
MNIIPWVVWRIVLHDPVDARDVEAAGGDVRAEEDARAGVDEFEEGVGAFLLLLFALGCQRSIASISCRQHP